MAHTGSCANSQRNRCRCSCGGSLHGGGRPGTSFTYIQPGRSTRIVRSEDPRQCSAAEVFSRLIESYGNLAAAASDCIVDMVSEACGVNRRGSLRRNHTICKILVEMVKALDHLGKKPPERIGQAVEKAWPPGHRIEARLAGKSAKLVAAAIYAAATGGHLAAIIHNCRVLAVATCPDIDRHREVSEVCGGPLVQGELRGYLKRDLEQLVSNHQRHRGDDTR